MTRMISRERVRNAIHFRGVDRIPHWLSDGKEDDILWLWTARAPDPQPWTAGSDGMERRIDAWGVTWARPVGEQYFGEKASVPIPDIARQADYVMPDQNKPEFFEEVRRVIAENNAGANPKYCLGVMPFVSLNEGVHNLTELDQMFLAYYEEPVHLKALIGRLAELQRESIRRLHAIGCDGVMGFDDWGLQDRLMISMKLIEEFFMPHYVENWRLAHELGMDVWLHSCGNILPLLPKLHEWGLDVIQPCQQENMGLENLDRTVGGRLAFWCPVDIQKTMVYGSVEDIRNYIKLMMTTIGNHNGGLCGMAYPAPETVGHTPEKVAAMCAAFRELGVYPQPGSEPDRVTERGPVQLVQHELGAGARLVLQSEVEGGLDLTVSSDGPFCGWIAVKCLSPLRVECPDRVQASIETIHHRFGYGVIEIFVESGEAVREATVKLRMVPPPAAPSPHTPADFEQFSKNFTARNSRFPDHSVDEFLGWQNRYRARVRECLWGEDWHPPEKCADVIRQVVLEKPEYLVECLTHRSFTGHEAATLFATPRASRGSPAPLVVAIHGHETRWGEAVLEAFEPGHVDDFCHYFASHGWAVLQPPTMNHALQGGQRTLMGQWLKDLFAAFHAVLDRIVVPSEK